MNTVIQMISLFYIIVTLVSFIDIIVIWFSFFCSIFMNWIILNVYIIQNIKYILYSRFKYYFVTNNIISIRRSVRGYISSHRYSAGQSPVMRCKIFLTADIFWRRQTQTQVLLLSFLLWSGCFRVRPKYKTHLHLGVTVSGPMDRTFPRQLPGWTKFRKTF